MKNLIIRIGSLLFLAIIPAVISTQAQTIQKSYRAQIPFDFDFGGKTYLKGEYKVSIFNRNGINLLSVENAETRAFRQLPSLRNGIRSKNGETILRFSQYGDYLVLTKIISPDFGLSLPKPNLRKFLAKKARESGQNAAVILVNKDALIN